MEIRSYRSVFDLERRIYSIDRLRLNPGGVPVRGVVYLSALLGCLLLARRLPVLGALTRSAPWYLLDLALPALLATVLASLRIEGRNFHQAARAIARHRLAPRRLSGLKGPCSVGRVWYPPDILALPDGSDASPRRLRYRGPGAALIAHEHRREGVPESDGRGLRPRAPRASLLITVREGAPRAARCEVIVLNERASLVIEGGCRA